MCVTRSSDGVKHGKQGPELGWLLTDICTYLGTNGFSLLLRQTELPHAW